MKISKLLSRLLAVGAVAVVAAAPSIAKADYVCSTFYYPGSSILGNEGYISATYYSAPGCTGSYLYSKAYCSPGANTASCASSSAYHYGREAILALAEGLRTAAETGQRVGVYTSTCIYGSSGCGSVVTFHGN